MLGSIAGCAAAAIADPLMTLVDTSFVGLLGTIPLASLGPNVRLPFFLPLFSSPHLLFSLTLDLLPFPFPSFPSHSHPPSTAQSTIFNTVFLIGTFTFAVVTTDRVAAARASGDPTACGHAVNIGIATAALFGLAAAAALYAFAPQALAAAGSNPEILGAATDYLRWRALACPATLVMVVGQACYRGALDLRTPLAVVAASAAANLALDPLLMFGLGMGVKGAALATMIAQVGGAAAMLALLRRDWHKFGLPEPTPEAPAPPAPAPSFAPASAFRALARAVDLPAWCRGAPTLPELRGFLAKCGVLLVRASLIIAVWTCSGAVANCVGTLGAAGHQLIQSLQMLQLNVTYAFLSVGHSMVANRRGQAGAARQVADRVVVLGFSLSALLAVATWALREQLPRLVTRDPAVLAAVAPALVPACLMLFASANNAVEGTLLGAGDDAFVASTYVPSVGVALGVLASTRALGLAGVWWALAAYYGVLLLLLTGRYLLPAGAGGLGSFGGPGTSDEREEEEEREAVAA